MTETTDRRADNTKQEMLRAAARQFAGRPYHQVGLDDVLSEAGLTKGAMYFHFRSKHDLALAVIEGQATKHIAAVQELVERKLSGLETLIDVGYLMAVADLSEDAARAAMHLLEEVGRIDRVQATLVERWTQILATIVERAVAEGDIVGPCDPHDVGRIFVWVYMGLRRTSDLDQPEQFLRDFEKNLVLVLRTMVRPDRADYFRQFIKRRTALAIKTVAAASDTD